MVTIRNRMMQLQITTPHAHFFGTPTYEYCQEATAVAGIYGMNFQNMPELTWHYGYFGVLALIGVGCTALFANFKRLDWL